MRFKKPIFIELIAVTSALALTASVTIPRFLRAQNINTAQFFPDPAFHKSVQDFMDVKEGERFTTKETYLKTGELNCIPVLEPPNSVYPILKSIEGLEFFPHIEVLRCSYLHLDRIDLSKNPKIKKVILHGVKTRTLPLIIGSGDVQVMTYNVPFSIDPLERFNKSRLNKIRPVDILPSSFIKQQSGNMDKRS